MKNTITTNTNNEIRNNKTLHLLDRKGIIEALLAEGFTPAIPGSRTKFELGLNNYTFFVDYKFSRKAENLHNLDLFVEYPNGEVILEASFSSVSGLLECVTDIFPDFPEASTEIKMIHVSDIPLVMPEPNDNRRFVIFDDVPQTMPVETDDRRYYELSNTKISKEDIVKVLLKEGFRAYDNFTDTYLKTCGINEVKYRYVIQLLRSSFYLTIESVDEAVFKSHVVFESQYDSFTELLADIRAKSFANLEFDLPIEDEELFKLFDDSFDALLKKNHQKYIDQRVNYILKNIRDNEELKYIYIVGNDGKNRKSISESIISILHMACKFAVSYNHDEDQENIYYDPIYQMALAQADYIIHEYHPNDFDRISQYLYQSDDTILVLDLDDTEKRKTCKKEACSILLKTGFTNEYKNTFISVSKDKSGNLIKDIVKIHFNTKTNELRYKLYVVENDVIIVNGKYYSDIDVLLNDISITNCGN